MTTADRMRAWLDYDRCPSCGGVMVWKVMIALDVGICGDCRDAKKADGTYAATVRAAGAKGPPQ
jgi:hypothetical protein